jgi:hypothetical protein
MLYLYPFGHGMLLRMPCQWTDTNGNLTSAFTATFRQLVGLTHVNHLGNDRVALARKLSIGTSLVLVAYPNNPADRNAVLIYREDDQADDLGYLDSVGARMLCKLMERDAQFSAEVHWIDNDNINLPKVYIYVYQLSEPVHRRRPRRTNAPKYKRGVTLLPLADTQASRTTLIVEPQQGENESYLSRFVQWIISYFR